MLLTTAWTPRFCGIRYNDRLRLPFYSSTPWRPREPPATRVANCCSGCGVVFWIHVHLPAHLDDVPNIRKGEMSITATSILTLTDVIEGWSEKNTRTVS